MLQIGEEQLALLHADLIRRSEQRIVEHLASNFEESEVPWPREGWGAIVRTLTTRALHYGIEDLDNVTSFVDFAFLLKRDDFDLVPEFGWAAEILTNPNIDDSDKVHAVADVLSEQAEK